MKYSDMVTLIDGTLDNIMIVSREENGPCLLFDFYSHHDVSIPILSPTIVIYLNLPLS